MRPPSTGPEAAHRLEFLTDSELVEFVLATLAAEDHDLSRPYALDTFDDLDRLQQASCNAIPPGYIHPIRYIAVWSDVRSGAITIELPNGLRLATGPLCLRRFHDPATGSDLRSTVTAALAELIYQAHQLVVTYEATLTHRWWHHRPHLRLLARITRTRS